MSTLPSMMLNETIAITIDKKGDSELVQNKLFSLGCGYFNGCYPLDNSIEKDLPIYAIVVSTRGYLSIIMDSSERKDIPFFSSNDLLISDFSSDRNRIIDKIKETEIKFDASQNLQMLFTVSPCDLSVELASKLNSLCDEIQDFMKKNN